MTGYREKVYSWFSIILFCLGFAFILFLNGAVPFISLPKLAPAVWTTGFSQSFINNSLLSIYAQNIGLPQPAAISFGLAGAYPAGLFIAAGFHPADAYSCMVALWLLVAFVGAWNLSRYFQVSSLVSIMLATLWLSLPIVWMHDGYSMLSLGIALLPFYFMVCLKLFYFADNIFIVIPVYFIACLISVFMDGYTFMMFAVGSSFLGGYCFVYFNDRRQYLLKRAFPVHVLAFFMAYLFFIFYIGKPSFARAPIDFFRGWGVDLTFLMMPTKGVHWLWDMLNLSYPRSGKVFFGDDSVWVTTFSMPLIVSGIVGWCFIRKQKKLASAFFIIFLIGFYLALGPSLKINSIKPESMGRLMPAEFAIVSTGSSWISETVPGFNNMRAAYRWSALGMFGLWCLLVLSSSGVESKRIYKKLNLLLLVILIFLYVPNLQNRWHCKVNYRKSFLQIDDDLLFDMKLDLHEGECVAFLPFRNDFLVNYLASRLKICTYNIGGDKNLAEARQHWPATMKQFRMAQVDSGFYQRILFLLAKHDVDAVILPYIDMLWAAHRWPYPTRYKKSIKAVESNLAKSGVVDIVNRDFYSVVRLTHKIKAGSR